MAIDHDQVAFVRDFMLYLTEQMKHKAHDFEELHGLSKQELHVLRSVAAKNSMMVKGVSAYCSDMSLSSLTRILNSLEDKGTIIRKLNREDRRSFIVEITDKGREIADQFNEFIEQWAELMLKGLTPAERLMMVELYTKVWATLKEENSKEGMETAVLA